MSSEKGRVETKAGSGRPGQNGVACKCDGKPMQHVAWACDPIDWNGFVSAAQRSFAFDLLSIYLALPTVLDSLAHQFEHIGQTQHTHNVFATRDQ
jgi:hypothetical protein